MIPWTHSKELKNYQPVAQTTVEDQELEHGGLIISPQQLAEEEKLPKQQAWGLCYHMWSSKTQSDTAISQ